MIHVARVDMDKFPANHSRALSVRSGFRPPLKTNTRQFRPGAPAAAASAAPGLVCDSDAPPPEAAGSVTPIITAPVRH